MSTRTDTLAAILEEAPRDCWLAVDEQQMKVVGSGKDPQDVVNEAKAKGTDDPLLVWAPPQWVPHVL